MTTDALKPVGEALTAIERLLDQVDPDRLRVEPVTRLKWVRAARRVRGRVDALTALLTGEAERAQAAERTAGTPLASWLGMGETLSRREAAGALHQAWALAAHPVLAQAATAGDVGGGQVRAITKVLDALAPQLSTGEQAAAEGILVTLAGHLDSDQLSKASAQVLAEVAPARADEFLETKLQREVEAAHRARSLRFFREGASVRFDGSLPRIEAETWMAELDAHGEALRRTAIEARDPAAELATAEQRRADSLIALIHAAANSKPNSGVGVARVIVQIDYDRLRSNSAAAGHLGDGGELSAGELRRLCCDAEVIPTVLGGRSEVLDVGRSARLVTPAIRTALILRDGGCTFPGCDLRPNLCEAHHIQPWWDGGDTALHNLVLLCHTHHGVIEPAKFGLRDQWQVGMGTDGLPEFQPPARMDQRGVRLRHRRHQPPGELSRPPTPVVRC